MEQYTGKMIVLEGPDGGGKTTAAKHLQTLLESRGYDVVITREPGGSDMGEDIRNLLFKYHWPAKAELSLFAAQRIAHLEHTVLPALRSGKVVICDRFIDSTYAYQHGGAGLSEEMVAEAERYAIGDFLPDYTLFFDIPLEESLRRLKERADRDGKTDRFDEVSMDYRKRVYDAYVKRFYAEMERRYMHRINALPELPDVLKQVSEWVNFTFVTTTA